MRVAGELLLFIVIRPMLMIEAQGPHSSSRDHMLILLPICIRRLLKMSDTSEEWRCQMFEGREVVAEKPL